MRSVLQLLADTSGQNIVVSDSVTGNLTLRLQNVPWDQALDIVLRTKGLDKRRQDNVIIIGPTEELATREKAELAAHKEVQELSPIRTEFMQVNYAKVTDLAKLIKTTQQPRIPCSRRAASLSIDERTNTLLVQDTADNLADIRRLVQTLDVPVQAGADRSAHRDRQRHLRTRPGRTLRRHQRAIHVHNGLLAVTGNGVGADTIVQSAITNLQEALRRSRSPRRHWTIATWSICRPRTPTAASASRLLAGSTLVDLELSAAQNEGKSETISSPRVITANQKQATIMQGVEIPYQESASSGATTTQFKNAVL